MKTLPLLRKNLQTRKALLCIGTALLLLCNTLHSSKLIRFQIIDKDYLMLHLSDAEVRFVDDGKGPTAFMHHTHDATNNYIVRYGEPFNFTAAKNPENWKIISESDSRYSGYDLPLAVFRKSKVNGQLEKEYKPEDNDFDYEYTNEHYLFLKLPKALIPGMKYCLIANKELNINKDTIHFFFNPQKGISDAIHLNINGYMSDSPIKSADIYLWMGDGKYRDYSSFKDSRVHIINTKTNQTFTIGNLRFGSKQRTDLYGHNLINSPVWHADFSYFNKAGTYRLFIDDIGCSREFEIRDDIYFEPFRVSMLGYLYMRVGQDSTGGIVPVPRRPLYIPGKNPENTKIYVTDLHPYKKEWKVSGFDTWDLPAYFRKFIKEGNPQNLHAHGGHADALDWDRHLGHVSIIYDLLFPYILSEGKLDDDDLGIPESGNGIPDILDEARNEVDFFLSLRYKGGYAHGISNPGFHSIFNHKNTIDSAWINVLFQSGNTCIAAWANAANSAMLAYAFQISGHHDLSARYSDSALNAYNFASSRKDQMLDSIQDVGISNMRGRDFKLTAASFLFNLTGKKEFEEVIYAESEIKSADSEIIRSNEYNQFWASIGYVFTPQTVSFPELKKTIKQALIHQALKREVDNMDKRPSRRSTDEETAYFHTIQNVHRSIAAHALSEIEEEKETFLKAIILEADYGLGRNPLNIIQMTTASTHLEDKPCIENMFTSGRDDGTPGLHPGHTPYLNLNDWLLTRVEGQPGILTAKCYPAAENWPVAELYFNTRYMFAHSEFTPQQTMRGKTALYTYLYFLGKK